MNDFDIHVRTDGEIRTIECTGPLPAGGTDELAKAIDSCIEEGATRLNLNLRQLSCGDPVIFDVLASKAKQCHQRGIRIGLSGTLQSEVDDFTINIKRVGNDHTIECHGPLTARELSKLDETIDVCLDEGATQVNLDLRHVTYADPIMVDVLAIQGELCRELGIRVGLSFGEAVRKTLNSVGFDELLACGIELQQTIRLTAPLVDNGKSIPHALTSNGFADRAAAHDPAAERVAHSM